MNATSPYLNKPLRSHEQARLDIIRAWLKNFRAGQ